MVLVVLVIVPLVEAKISVAEVVVEVTKRSSHQDGGLLIDRLRLPCEAMNVNPWSLVLRVVGV
jgi:hypothetical protein